MALFHRSTTPQTHVSGLWATPVHRCSSRMTSTHRAAARVAFVHQEEVVCCLWRRLLKASVSNEPLVTIWLLRADVSRQI